MILSKQQLIALAIFFLIAVGVIFLLGAYSVQLDPGQLTAAKSPAWLRSPIPNIDRIKTTITDPRFKQLEYQKAYFEPVEVGPQGRPNPFIPFLND